MNAIECPTCATPATIANTTGLRTYQCPTCQKQWSNETCDTRGCGRMALAACRHCQDYFCSNHVSRERVCGRCKARA